MTRFAAWFQASSIADRLQGITLLLLAGSAASALVSVAVSAILLAFAILAAILQCRQWNRGTWLPVSILLPMVLLFVWTIAATVAGGGSLHDGLIKKCWLFSILLLVPVFVRGADGVKWIYRAIFAVAAVSAAAGILQFIANPNRDALNRIKGFMSIWMTFSGSIMLVLVALVAYAVAFGWKKHPWVLPLGFVLSASLFLSQTRNAWGGAFLGTAVILLLTRRPRLLFLLVTLLLAIYFVSPQRIQQRFRDGFNPNDPNTRNRIEVFTAAVRLIRAHPWIGVGQKVNILAPQYRDPSANPDWMFIHMHNNFLQIAAERGLPGLVIWAWFIFQLGWQALKIHRLPNSSDMAGFAAAAAVGAWVALLAAGMLEYNYGDSEVLTVFLFIMSLPHAAKAATSHP